MEEKDYKKLYEDVVALAKDGLKDGLYLSQSAKDVTEFLFPQLKETEDEKVKRELTKFLINYNNGVCTKPSEDKIDYWIKWINKNNNLLNFDEAEKEKNDFVSGQFIECRKSFNEFKELESYWLEYVGDDTYIGRSDNILNQKFHITPRQLFTLFTHEHCKKYYENQSEQNHTDEVKPKFKVGDWIVYDGLGTYKVVEIHEGWYSVIDSNDRRWSVMFEKESLCHLWTIQDAKDGDILTSINEKQPFIFKGLLDPFHPTSPVAYCGIDCEEHFIVSTGVSWWADAGEPASKEIVDLLFKSIKEAGYEWNSEKKELNKIEQKPTEWSLPYGKNETAEKLIALAECLEMDGDCLFNGLSGNDYGKFLRVLAIELTQPKQEWSKEDSERLLRIHQFIWANRKGDTDEIYQQEQDADWIMSLNPQQNNYDKGYNDGYSAAKYNQWKPSEYDILLLENIASNIRNNVRPFCSEVSSFEDIIKNIKNL